MEEKCEVFDEREATTYNVYVTGFCGRKRKTIERHPKQPPTATGRHNGKRQAKARGYCARERERLSIPFTLNRVNSYIENNAVV
jgi:hypothetical protein